MLKFLRFIYRIVNQFLPRLIFMNIDENNIHLFIGYGTTCCSDLIYFYYSVPTFALLFFLNVAITCIIIVHTEKITEIFNRIFVSLASGWF